MQEKNWYYFSTAISGSSAHLAGAREMVEEHIRTYHPPPKGGIWGVSSENFVRVSLFWESQILKKIIIFFIIDKKNYNFFYNRFEIWTTLDQHTQMTSFTRIPSFVDIKLDLKTIGFHPVGWIYQGVSCILLWFFVINVQNLVRFSKKLVTF